jgi:hypothetical protein
LAAVATICNIISILFQSHLQRFRNYFFNIAILPTLLQHHLRGHHIDFNSICHALNIISTVLGALPAAFKHYFALFQISEPNFVSNGGSLRSHFGITVGLIFGITWVLFWHHFGITPGSLKDDYVFTSECQLGSL